MENVWSVWSEDLKTGHERNYKDFFSTVSEVEKPHKSISSPAGFESVDLKGIVTEKLKGLFTWVLLQKWNEIALLVK